MVYNQVSHQYEEVRWRNVKVGDFVMLSNKMQVPADIIVLATSDKEGLGYVSTATLDGE